MYIAHLSTAITLNQTVLNCMVMQKNSGHRVVALCPDDEWTVALKERGIEVFEIPFIRHSLRHSFTSSFIKTIQVCRREKFDVVHTHTLLPGIAGRVAARIAGIPAVVHTFHSWPLHKPRGRAFTAAYQALELLSAMFGHIHLFQNADDLQSWSKIPGIPTKKALLIGNGIDTTKILSNAADDARSRVRAEFGIPDDTVLISMVARLELYKGHAMLLRAMRAIEDTTGQKITALIVGIGKDRPQIEAEAASLGLQDSVLFTGYRLDVPNLLRASDISVLTSQYEGIPRALMESMVLGVPVIGTDVPGSRTLIRSGENGLLVPHDNVPALITAIRCLIENPVLARRLAENGRQTILEEFDENKVTARMVQVYSHILASHIPQLSDLTIEADS